LKTNFLTKIFPIGKLKKQNVKSIVDNFPKTTVDNLKKHHKNTQTNIFSWPNTENNPVFVKKDFTFLLKTHTKTLTFLNTR